VSRESGGTEQRSSGGGRAALAAVPTVERELAPTVWFCSHCAAQPARPKSRAAAARVCEECGFGLLLETAAEVAPAEDGAFMVLDRSLSVCALSAAAEQLLAARETEAVNRHVTELLVPADAEAQAGANLASAITWAASGDETSRSVVVRPANIFGVRLHARITSCSPPRAALLVFDSPGR
jgi:hypothetical protein